MSSVGCIVPLGNMADIIAPSEFRCPWSRPVYTEYIVHDEARIQLRYLVHFQLNDGSKDEDENEDEAEDDSDDESDGMGECSDD